MGAFCYYFFLKTCVFSSRSITLGQREQKIAVKIFEREHMIAKKYLSNSSHDFIEHSSIQLTFESMQHRN